MTDVTGFGLAGHALEMARGSGCTLEIDWSLVPFLPGVMDLAGQGCITGASARNWASYGSEVALPANFADMDRALLTDPQTSGGLLVSCSPEALDGVAACFADHGFSCAIIGSAAVAGTDKPALTITG